MLTIWNMYFNYNFQISPWYSVKWKGPTQMYHVCMRAKSLQSCLTFYDPMDCSPPGSSILGILQAWILECVAMPFSRGSSRPRDWTCVCYHLLRWQVGSLPLVPSTFYFSGALRALYSKGGWYEDSWEPEVAGRPMCLDPQGLSQTEPRSIH